MGEGTEILIRVARALLGASLFRFRRKLNSAFLRYTSPNVSIQLGPPGAKPPLTPGTQNFYQGQRSAAPIERRQPRPLAINGLATNGEKVFS